MFACRLLRHFGFREIRIEGVTNSRLDSYLVQTGRALNWGKVHALIKSQAIFVKSEDNKRHNQASYQLMPNDKILVREHVFADHFENAQLLPSGKVFRKIGDSDFVDQMIDEITVFKNDEYMVVNKPPGMFSQGTPILKLNIASLVNSYFDRYRIPKQAFIVHRLDRPVSGLMVIATKRSFAAEFSELLKLREAEKIYECWVDGLPAFYTEEKLTATTLSAFIGFNQSKQAAFIGTKDNQECSKGVCEVELLDVFSRDSKSTIGTLGTKVADIKKLQNRVAAGERFVSRLRFKLLTGKRHQIRLFSAKICNTPIIYDFKYGYKKCVKDDAEQTIHELLISEDFLLSSSQVMSNFLREAYLKRDYIYLQSVKLSFKIVETEKITKHQYTCKQSHHMSLLSQAFNADSGSERSRKTLGKHHLLP